MNDICEESDWYLEIRESSTLPPPTYFSHRVFWRWLGLTRLDGELALRRSCGGTDISARRSVESSPRYVRQAGRARGMAREIGHLIRASVRDVFVRRVSVRHAGRSRRRRRRCHVGGKPCLYKIVVSPSESTKSIKTVHALTFQHLAHLKLQLSEKFRTAKTTWDTDPRHHGTEAASPSQEVVPGQNAERSGAHGGPDPHWLSKYESTKCLD